MTQSALLDLFRQRQARVAGPDEAPFLLTMGAVPAEYAAARERCVLFDTTDREQVIVSGAEAAAFLHRLLANEVKAQPDSTRRENMLLSAKGKVRFSFTVERCGPEYLVCTSHGQAKLLADALEMYHFSEQVQFAVNMDWARLELCGPQTGLVLQAVQTAALPTLSSGLSHVVDTKIAGVPCRLAAAVVAGSLGWTLDVPRATAPQVVTALETAGAQLAGRVVKDSLRVEACHPEALLDIDEGVYPQEARLERAFALDKGCYIGQEVVAKIDTYGGLNKRLVALRISHEDPVPRGGKLIKVEDGERRELGLVTSWAWSFVLDGGLVLAYVKRRHQAVGTVFELEGGGTATIVPTPVRPDAVLPTGDFE